ncbi:hypothetical protein JAAARDRAFT_199040 [Jaapia argillacea MUCL 33604]|uniref:Uncharacterized protein n=1 Tax=Jaapia argillacea MUCL 33604 TaxID=933084 RepID=A0A067PA00_9AGAM|nr:hypothetical protein JAAARDRAFT_199040 [Jaapia argillacea MUCL 33604]
MSLRSTANLYRYSVNDFSQEIQNTIKSAGEMVSQYGNNHTLADVGFADLSTGLWATTMKIVQSFLLKIVSTGDIAVDYKMIISPPRPHSELLDPPPSSTSTTPDGGAGSAGAKKSKLDDPGARKTSPLDFEAAAEAEEQRRKEAELLEATTKVKARAMGGRRAWRERLGFGGIPVANAPASTSSSCAPTEDSPTFTCEKFGTQEAISSDMYFGRNSYDSDALSEAQQHLSAF